jgi:hypothetical protein
MRSYRERPRRLARLLSGEGKRSPRVGVTFQMYYSLDTNIPFRQSGSVPAPIHPNAVDIREVSIKFATEEQCLEYVEQMRWPDGVVRCPTCVDKKVKRVMRTAESKNKRPWFYLCLNKGCHQQFSPTAGTLLADSHLPLKVWFHAIGLILNAEKEISAKQLQRDLGIGGYKTAWYLNHRIRESMKDGDPQPLGGIVEIDEAYVGARIRDKGIKFAKKEKKPQWVR